MHGGQESHSHKGHVHAPAYCVWNMRFHDFCVLRSFLSRGQPYSAAAAQQRALDRDKATGEIGSRQQRAKADANTQNTNSPKEIKEYMSYAATNQRVVAQHNRQTSAYPAVQQTHPHLPLCQYACWVECAFPFDSFNLFGLSLHLFCLLLESLLLSGALAVHTPSRFEVRYHASRPPLLVRCAPFLPWLGRGVGRGTSYLLFPSRNSCLLAPGKTRKEGGVTSSRACVFLVFS